MRRSLSSASIGMIYGGTGVVGDVFIDQGVALSELTESIEISADDSTSISVSDVVNVVEITESGTSVDIIKFEGNINVE